MTPYDVPSPAAEAAKAPLIDPFGRTVDYLRVSVTDRCDLRCVYCMAERQTFLPKAEHSRSSSSMVSTSALGRKVCRSAMQ